MEHAVFFEINERLFSDEMRVNFTNIPSLSQDESWLNQVVSTHEIPLLSVQQEIFRFLLLKRSSRVNHYFN